MKIFERYMADLCEVTGKSEDWIKESVASVSFESRLGRNFTNYNNWKLPEQDSQKINDLYKTIKVTIIITKPIDDLIYYTSIWDIPGIGKREVPANYLYVSGRDINFLRDFCKDFAQKAKENPSITTSEMNDFSSAWFEKVMLQYQDEWNFNLSAFHIAWDSVGNPELLEGRKKSEVHVLGRTYKVDKQPWDIINPRVQYIHKNLALVYNVSHPEVFDDGLFKCYAPIKLTPSAIKAQGIDAKEEIALGATAEQINLQRMIVSYIFKENIEEKTELNEITIPLSDIGGVILPRVGVSYKNDTIFYADRETALKYNLNMEAGLKCISNNEIMVGLIDRVEDNRVKYEKELRNVFNHVYEGGHLEDFPVFRDAKSFICSKEYDSYGEIERLICQADSDFDPDFGEAYLEYLNLSDALEILKNHKIPVTNEYLKDFQKKYM